MIKMKLTEEELTKILEESQIAPEEGSKIYTAVLEDRLRLVASKLLSYIPFCYNYKAELYLGNNSTDSVWTVTVINAKDLYEVLKQVNDKSKAHREVFIEKTTKTITDEVRGLLKGEES